MCDELNSLVARLTESDKAWLNASDDPIAKTVRTTYKMLSSRPSDPGAMGILIGGLKDTLNRKESKWQQ